MKLINSIWKYDTGSQFIYKGKIISKSQALSPRHIFGWVGLEFL